MDLGVASIFLNVSTSDQLEEVCTFYQQLGLRVVSRLPDCANLHLFATELTSLTISIRIDPLCSPKDKITCLSDLSQSELLNKRYLNLSLKDINLVKQNLVKSRTCPFIDSSPLLWIVDPLNNLISVRQVSANSHEPDFVYRKELHSHAMACETVDGVREPQPHGTQREAHINLLRSAQVLDSTLSLVSEPKRRIGILTSGGDSSGMNAAVRSITRYALQRSCQPFAIFEGYNGLVEGGDKIKELGWEDVRGLLSMGGTVIGSARSATFRTREGRLDAAVNLIKNGIDALVVIGGDGSLTGADILRQEWPGLLLELKEKGRIEEVPESIKHLTIVGLVGSIDNDMSSTDMTIGAATSLHRICESLDSLTSTALSHQRAFVIEVMGRHCGWLALMAAIAVGADWVFLPERPPPLESSYGTDWETEMCDTLRKQKTMGSRAILVLVAEGAIDTNLNSIKSEYVKSVIEKNLGYDTRVTTLGHVQRGGKPCAYDRCLATLQGVEAVKAVLNSSPETPSPMIGISHNKMTNVSLMDAVKLTQSVGAAIAQKDFKKAMDLRDPDFTAAYDAYIESTLLATGPGHREIPEENKLRIGILHMGAPAGGMNAATRTAVRLCLNRGHVPLAIRNGFSGLLRDEVYPITWKEVNGWQTKGGSQLGTNRDHPDPSIAGPEIDDFVKSFVDLGTIAYHLQKNEVQALLVIGGFEAFTSLSALHRTRHIYPAFCIPMVHLPATISNNVPGTDFSIGSDTASNVIVEACDSIKLSANASRSRVFVVEVQGGQCGYLAAMGGLICGAATVYIPERGISLDMIQKDLKHLCRRYEDERRLKIPHEGRIILRTETAGGDVYTTNVLCNILKAEGNGLFDSRTTILGHLQQGGVPSPLDRIKATRLAVNCVDWLQNTAVLCKKGVNEGCPDIYTNKKEHCCVIGIRGANVVITPIEDLILETDINKRRGNDAWWMELTDLTKTLAKFEFFSD